MYRMKMDTPHTGAGCAYACFEFLALRIGECFNSKTERGAREVGNWLTPFIAQSPNYIVLIQFCSTSTH